MCSCVLVHDRYGLGHYSIAVHHVPYLGPRRVDSFQVLLKVNSFLFALLAVAANLVCFCFVCARMCCALHLSFDADGAAAAQPVCGQLDTARCAVLDGSEQLGAVDVPHAAVKKRHRNRRHHR